MPVTRRKRANPPEEPENTNNHVSEETPREQAAETVEQAPKAEEAAAPTPAATPTEEEQGQAPAETAPPPQPVQPQAAEQAVEAPGPGQEEAVAAHAPVYAPVPPVPPVTAPSPSANGDHPERQEVVPPAHVEGVRRTFRRPSPSQQPSYGQSAQYPQQPQAPAQYQPQQAQQPPVAPPSPPQLQPPTHEITLPLGNLLHLAYNPGYTGAEEARSHLLSQLARESKAGGRARCWNCGSLAVTYERWNTRSRTFGEIGVAFCEICGVWSVM